MTYFSINLTDVLFQTMVSTETTWKLTMFQIGVWQKVKFVLEKDGAENEAFEVDVSSDQNEIFIDINSAVVSIDV